MFLKTNDSGERTSRYAPRAAGALIALIVCVILAACSASSTTTAPQPIGTESTPKPVAGDSEPATAPAANADASTSEPERPAPAGSSPCLLDRDEVATAVGRVIVDQSINGGGAFDNDIAFAWAGCSYETADGGRYAVGRLEDNDVFTDLAALADRVPPVVDLGDESFFSGDDLFVFAGGDTIRLSIERLSLEVADLQLMVDVAKALLAAGDADARCALLPSVLPDAWQPSTEVRQGGGGAGDITFDSCSVALGVAQGAGASIRTAPGRLYFDDAIKAAPDVAVPLDGVGDQAFVLGDRAFVLVGTTGLVIDGGDGGSDSLARLALAAADAASDG